MSHDLPFPRVHTLGSNEGRMQHNELMDLVTKLSDRVVALETDLTQTKKVYGAAFTKLIKKVKRLEKKDKLSKSRRKLRLVLSDEEGSDSDILAQEDPSKQGRKIAQIDEDEGITLVQMGVSTASTDFTTANVPVTTAGAEISTASPEVKTAGDSVDDIVAESLVYIRRNATKIKDKAVRLQEEFDEEERQRIARVHEAARSFSEVEWEDIRARVEAFEDYYETTDRVKYKSTSDMITKQRCIGVPELVAGSSKQSVTGIYRSGGTKRAAEEELVNKATTEAKKELFTHKEEIDLETAQLTTTVKLPTLKQGEFDMWRLRIEQYFQVQDYALWNVIENGNSFKPAAKTTTNADGTSTTLIPGPVTTEEKV
ncbi:hypothetical protein Tco_1577897 [Tanacetum coccineum]